MRWFKRHPDLLKEYSIALSSDSNYSESWQKRGFIFLSCGEIIVRLDEIRKLPILIAYSDATPYVLPSVYLLNELIPESYIDSLSKKNNLHELSDAINAFKKLFYFRHQGANGSLCLLDADNLGDDEVSYYSAHQIIERVRVWYKSYLLNQFPPELPQVEPFAHYPHKVTDIEILYPEIFLNNNSQQGEFYGFPYFMVPIRNGIDKIIFLGSILTVETSTGIQKDAISFKNRLFILPPELSTPIDLLTKTDLIKSWIDTKKVLKGYYFSVAKEPSIFLNHTDIASYLNDDQDEGYILLLNKIGNDLKSLLNYIYLGFRYLNRHNKYEWHFIRLEKVGSDAASCIGPLSLDNGKCLLDNYAIKAIRGEEISDQSFHSRNSSRAERKKLKDNEATIIGCGAIGSEIADILAKAGLGSIVLIDKEDLKVHNSIRHLCPTTMTGFPKSLLVKFCIEQHNPFVDSEWKEIDITDIDINEYMSINSIGISSIADDNIEGYLNEQAVINNRTIFYVRALRGGKAARIFRVIPGKDACFHCLTLYKNDSESEYIRIPEDPDLDTLYNECNNPIRPASAADLKLISSIASRIVLDYMQNRNDDFNHWVWQTEDGIYFPGTKSDPFSLLRQNYSPHPSCYYCNMLNPISVLLEVSAKEVMLSEIKKNPLIETGGILAGFQNGRIINITHASLPGPQAKKERTLFSKDIVFCQKCLDDLYIESSGKTVYAGEWHYHPSGSNSPSNIDLSSMNDISKQAEYLVDEPIMLIVSSTGAISCTVHPANKTFYKSELNIINEN